MQDGIKLNHSAFRLLRDSQVVITQRTLGLCGLRPIYVYEPNRKGRAWPPSPKSAGKSQQITAIALASEQNRDNLGAEGVSDVLRAQ